MEDNQFDLSAASEGALADLNADIVEAPVAPTQSATSTVPAPQVATSTESDTARSAPETSGQATPTGEPDAALQPGEVEIVWKGKPQRLQQAQVIEYAQKGFDYTQKSMALAAERQQFEVGAKQFVEQMRTQQAAREEQILAALRDEQAAQRLIAWARGQALTQTGAAPAPASDDILTAQQVQQLVQSQVESARARDRQEYDLKIAAANAQLATNRYQQEYVADIRGTVTQLASKYPALADAYGGELEEVLKKDVREQLLDSPTDDINHARTLLINAARTRAERLQKLITNHTKTAVARQGRLVTSSPEPPGGTPPATSPSKPLSLNSPELRALVLAAIQGA